MADKEAKLCMGCMSPHFSGGSCGVCGYDPKTPAHPDFLPPETRLAGRYIVGKMTACDPEGAWYAGYDTQDELRVWIREYAPMQIASRQPVDYSLHPLPSAEAQYKALMSDFEDLCRSLMKLSVTEKVLPVLDMLRSHNTAYAIYRYIKTLSLESFLVRSGGKLSWRHTKKLLMPLYHTVSNVHKAGLIHRGLSPQTVHLDQSGALWLNHFTIAAARTNKSEISAQLFDGYSAPEQYSLNSWQGTWTDVYALGAITYRMVTGELPPPAMDRVYGDDLLDSQITSAEMTESIVNAINKALAFEVEDRTQTAETFIADLLATEGSNTAVYNAPSARKSYETPDDSQHRQEIRQAAADRAAQDARGGIPKGRRFENYGNSGLDLMPAPQPPRREPLYKENTEVKSKARSRKKKKKSHPILLLMLSALVATALLGFGVYYITTHFLGDLIWPGKNASSSQVVSEDSSVNAGVEFNQQESPEDGSLPRFVGATAESLQTDQGLNKKYNLVYEEKFNKEYAVGVIYDQLPVEGTQIKDGEPVTLYVSKGIERVSMPLVAGLPIEEVATQLTALKIPFDIIQLYDNNEDVAPGTVIRTNTEPGVLVEAASTEQGAVESVGAAQVVLFIKSEAASNSEEDDEEKLPKDEEEDPGDRPSSSKVPRKTTSSSSSKKSLTRAPSSGN